MPYAVDAISRWMLRWQESLITVLVGDESTKRSMENRPRQKPKTLEAQNEAPNKARINLSEKGRNSPKSDSDTPRYCGRVRLIPQDNATNNMKNMPNTHCEIRDL
jgi:hypothetical protein